mmetsp:Transcript_48447/g.136275  ORF Transcript_48447/g.136275 Transcript_48447/m.136275 type:complete len:474 (-) Transcript_48447:46-1467(-)
MFRCLGLQKSRRTEEGNAKVPLPRGSILQCLGLEETKRTDEVAKVPFPRRPMTRCLGLQASKRMEEGTAKANIVQQSDLEAAMNEASRQVEPWDDTRIAHVRDLQEAARNHGNVQLMRDLQAGRLMAVKRMPNRWMRATPTDFAQRHPDTTEKPWLDVGLVRHLGNIDFPYVCKLYSIFRSGKETFVATTFCAEGDLFEWCFRDAGSFPGPEREAQLRPAVVQTFAAVRRLHDLGIAHRDISMENILLLRCGEGVKVKLIDFGMATLEREVFNEVRGKPSYQAPEVHTNKAVDTLLADEFALGVVLYAISVQEYPWTATKRGKCQLFEYVRFFGLRRFIRKRRLRMGPYQFLHQALSGELVDVLEALLHFRPRRRACLGEVAFQHEVRRHRRRSVWDMPYLHGAVLDSPPDPSDLELDPPTPDPATTDTPRTDDSQSSQTSTPFASACSQWSGSSSSSGCLPTPDSAPLLKQA